MFALFPLHDLRFVFKYFMLKIRSCSLPSTMHNFLVMFNYFIWLLFYSYSSLYSWFVFSCWMTHFLASSYWLYGSSSHDSWMTFFHVKYVNDVSFMPVVLFLLLHYTHGSFFDLPRLKMTVLYCHLSIWVIFHFFSCYHPCRPVCLVVFFFFWILLYVCNILCFYAFLYETASLCVLYVIY